MGAGRVSLVGFKARNHEQQVLVRGPRSDVDDRANLVPLCRGCHGAHHARSEVLPTRVLPDSAFAFARDLMGAGAAYEYLTRRYMAGNDPRVAALLDEWEEAA